MQKTVNILLKQQNVHMEEHKLQSFESTFQTTSFYFYVVICFSLIIFLLFNYSQNPLAIIIFISLLSFIILSSSIRKLIVYEDSFAFEYKRILNVFTTRKKFRFDEITSIEANLRLTKKNDIISTLLIFLTHTFFSNWNIIRITFKNGNEKTISSKIYREVYEKFFEEIKRKSLIEITILDKPKIDIQYTPSYYALKIKNSICEKLVDEIYSNYFASWLNRDQFLG